jgi:hypothetical protein
MAQADGIVSNASGAAVRADLNNQLAAVFTNHSGSTEPSTTYAYQWWADTTNGVMKLRNAANSAWITMFQLDGEWTSLALENGSAASPSIYFKDSGTDTGVYSPGTDQVGISTAGVQRVNFNGSTEVVFNDGGADVDFRIEGDTEENLFVIDAGTNEVRVANLNGGPLAGARNRIINGDMRIDQRNAGASVTSSGGGTFSVDRFASFASGGGAYTTQRSTDVPTGQGFVNSIASTVTTIDSPTGADYYIIQQSIEGFNTADLGWGTASAKSITISFWVKASITGTYTVAIRNGGNNRSYRAPYSITTANTWEQKIITAPGDTTGTWLTDNGTGIRLGFTLGAGADFIDTGNTWSALEDFAATGQTQWIATNGATFYITGVQLEAGTVATPFERRSYGQELALCQRYYQTYTSTGSNVFMMNFTAGGQANLYPFFGPEMRAAPTGTLTSSTVVNGTGAASAFSSKVFGLSTNSTSSGLAYFTAFNVNFAAEL